MKRNVIKVKHKKSALTFFIILKNRVTINSIFTILTNGQQTSNNEPPKICNKNIMHVAFLFNKFYKSLVT